MIIRIIIFIIIIIIISSIIPSFKMYLYILIYIHTFSFLFFWGELKYNLTFQYFNILFSINIRLIFIHY